MGASTSSDAELTLQGLIEEANRLLAKITEIVTHTVETSGVGAAMSDLHEKALAMIAATFATIEKPLAELGRQNEAMAACVRNKEAELERVKNKMKDKMLDCYNKYKDSFDKLTPERTGIHEEAEKIKLQTQKMIQDCMTSRDYLECYKKNFPEIKKKVYTIYKKFEALMKREADLRVTGAKRLIDCNKKAADAATKECNRIIEEIKKCGVAAVNK